MRQCDPIDEPGGEGGGERGGVIGRGRRLLDALGWHLVGREGLRVQERTQDRVALETGAVAFESRDNKSRN